MLKWDCVWSFKQIMNGQIIWQVERHNLLATEGEKALVDTIFRNNYSAYFPVTNFYVGLYKGSVSKATTLATIPGEPSLSNGYSRLLCERSNIGWPTIELDDNGNWRVVSKEMTLTANGGDIGPADGGFICTSSNNSGTLIGAVAMGVERTILSGAQMIIQLKAKIS